MSTLGDPAEEMSTQRTVGIIVLIVGLAWFFFAPATSIVSPPGTQTIYWKNIAPGIILLIIAITPLLAGRRTKPS